MLIKPIYDAYLRRCLAGVERQEYTPLEFLRLPYQMRLGYAGAWIKLTDQFKKSSLTIEQAGNSFPAPVVPLHHFVTNVPNPELETFIPCSWNDIHIRDIDKGWIMLFPFEYQIILHHEKI